MDIKYFICVLGMVLVIEGLPYAAAPYKIKTWLRQIMHIPESTLRGLGFLAMVIGLLLVAWGRS